MELKPLLILIAQIKIMFSFLDRRKRISVSNTPISNKRILMLFLLCGALGHSQNVEFEKANFPDKKEEFQEASRKLRHGYDFFVQGKKELDDFKKAYLAEFKFFPVSLHDYERAGYQHFKSAQSAMLEANRFNPKNAKLNYSLGFLSLMLEPSEKNAVQFMETALSLGIEPEGDMWFWIGWAFHLSQRWDEAIKYYNNYVNAIQMKPNKQLAAAVEDARKKVNECENGKELSQNPQRVFVDNLGPNINTSFPEYGPSITADEETIFFTSRRPSSAGSKKDESDNGYFEDVFSAGKMNGKWQLAKPISKNVNTEFHDAVSGLSPDGSKLFVFRSSYEDGGDLYQSTLFGLDWEEPTRLNKNINTKYHESSVSLSYDGRRLYFVSNRDNGIGDRDIYYCEIAVNGDWGLPKNIGTEINTKYGEEAVFMHPDGVTMYFSSKGHNSMGGYDIFKSTLENGKWQKPVNLGFPINGPDDDVFFVVSGSGNRAYFAGTKPGGYGDYDLYKITFLGPEKQPLLNSQDQLLAMVAQPVNNLKTETAIELKSAKLTILKGLINDEKSEKPLSAEIELIDNTKNELLATFQSNAATGKYLVTLPSGKNYGIAVKSKGYLFHSENIDLPMAAEFQEFNLDIGLKKIEVGSTVVLNNIFFGFNESTLKDESINELERLVQLIKDNPGIKLEIGSHTDNVGSEEYNKVLSEDRSKSVVNYLIQKGIPATKLVAVGYGEAKPVASNESETGRQKNRRTEFKVVGK